MQMDEKEFNLIDEPWIKVRTPTLAVETVSLREALLHAHTYVDLAGELPTQDMAVLRLLLAVLHTVFLRVNCDGRSAPLQKPGQALLRWKELWENGCIPEKPICDYLEQWHERFWLFHEILFRTTLTEGIGRGKAYGQGLLTLMRLQETRDG